MEDIFVILAKDIQSYKNCFRLTDDPLINFQKLILPEEAKNGLKYSEVALESGADGEYLNDKKQIIINDLVKYLPRKLFTIYHELSHYLIYNVFDETLSAIHEYDVNAKDHQLIIENLCNFSAAEFLIDNSIVSICLENGLPKIDVIKSYIKNPNFSAPALIYKLINNISNDCVGIIVRNSFYRPISNQKELALISLDVPDQNLKSSYVEYSFNSRNFKYPVKRFNLVEVDGCINSNFETQADIAQGDDKFPFSNSRTMPCYVYGFYKENRFFSFLVAKRANYISEDQLLLI